MLEIVKNEWNKEDLKRVDSLIDEDINVRLKKYYIETVNEKFQEENKVLEKIKFEVYLAANDDPIRRKPFTILNPQLFIFLFFSKTFQTRASGSTTTWLYLLSSFEFITHETDPYLAPNSKTTSFFKIYVFAKYCS
jgi:hypothetical protein